MAYRSTRIPNTLAGAESCGPNQQWDPNYVFNGIKGQCVPKGQPLVQMASSSPGFFESLMSAFSTPKYATPSAPAAPVVVQQGMSQNTMIAIGLGAVGLVALVMLARK